MVGGKVAEPGRPEHPPSVAAIHIAAVRKAAERTAAEEEEAQSSDGTLASDEGGEKVVVVAADRP